MKRIDLIWLALFVLLVVAASLVFLNPLRRDEAYIHDWILGQAPLGSSVKDVKSIIAKHDWKLHMDWQSTAEHPPLSHSEREYPYVAGSLIISADLGHYQGLPWRIDIEAFWGFDSQGKLIDVHVRKCADSL
jgi:hypothetical protein